MTQIGKPAKPYDSFPLTPHGSGKWAKKVQGTMYYFGRWEDPDGALREWNSRKGPILAGTNPTVSDKASMTVRELSNEFLDRQLLRVDNGRMQPRSFMDTKLALSHFAKVVDPNRLVSSLVPADFGTARDNYAKEKGPHTVNRYLANVKSAFNWGARNGKCAIPAFGDGFAKEKTADLRMSTREAVLRRGGRETFTPEEVRMILKTAPPPLKAMILLGLNAGFYAIDVATLPAAAVDLDDAWIEFPRAKTGVMRATPLWPETVKAMKDAAKKRGLPSNRADDGLFFVHRSGSPWVYVTTERKDGTIVKASRTDSINKHFLALLKSLGIRQPGINFAALRDTFCTLADELRDDNASRMIRGHAFHGMDAFYVKSIARPRLEKVTSHVRKRLLNANVIRSRSSPKRTARRCK